LKSVVLGAPWRTATKVIDKTQKWERPENSIWSERYAIGEGDLSKTNIGKEIRGEERVPNRKSKWRRATCNMM